MRKHQITPRTVSRNAIAQFAELTDDYSKIHLDLDYARSVGLKDNFAHGLLGASWATGWLSQIHSLSGNPSFDIPTAIECNFGSPVFCNDELSVNVLKPTLDPLESTSKKIFNFSLENQGEKITSHGSITFESIFLLTNEQEPKKLLPSQFTLNPKTIYYAENMYQDGPRGTCMGHTFSEKEVTTYIEYTGEQADSYKNKAKTLYLVPPLLVFCRAFSSWLKEFTKVQTPDGSFPGHIRDTFQQHRPVIIGDKIDTCHQVTRFRESNSRPDMALITITIQCSNQRNEMVLSGSVLLMMQCTPSAPVGPDRLND